jgi:hypothetical protein
MPSPEPFPSNNRGRRVRRSFERGIEADVVGRILKTAENTQQQKDRLPEALSNAKTKTKRKEKEKLLLERHKFGTKALQARSRGEPLAGNLRLLFHEEQPPTHS